MRYETVTVRHGENVGPVNWDHETAKNMPAIWRDAAGNCKGFGFDYGYGPREIIAVCMYDGWPYWEPRPAVCYVGSLGHAEWAFFDSYGVHKNSIVRREDKALGRTEE